MAQLTAPGRMSAHFTPNSITLKELSGTGLKTLVREDLFFVDPSGEVWIAPVGTMTDGASVPRAALPITDGRFDERFLKAAVVHDAYCQDDNVNGSSYHARPWRSVHRMFYDACIAGKTPSLQAKLMYLAVLWFGPRWNDISSARERISEPDRRIGFAAGSIWLEAADPSADEISEDVEHRERTIEAVARLQERGLSALQRGEPSEAERYVAEAEAILSKALQQDPGDLMYLNLKGYNHKNKALLHPDLAGSELEQAEQLFRQVLSVAPEDPSSWNGLGSVEIMRGHPDVAREYIHKALTILPDYPAAEHDLGILNNVSDPHGVPHRH